MITETTPTGGFRVADGAFQADARHLSDHNRPTADTR